MLFRSADYFISIHINSFKTRKANGTETYYYKYKDKQLSRDIQREMAKTLKLKNNGIKRARLYVLRNTQMPSALVEPLFITNQKEYKLLKDPNFREKIAISIQKGITTHAKRPTKKKKR